MLNTTQENRSLYSQIEDAPDFDQDRAIFLSKWLQKVSIISRSLDVGCSSGGFSSLLPQEVEKWGLDFERHPKLPEQFHFISCDIAQAWSVPKEYFDVVLAGEVIEHVLDTSYFLQQCFAVLRPGGHVLLTTPNLSSFANLRYWFQTDQYMWVDSSINQFGHVRYLAPKRMQFALEQAGFNYVVMGTTSGLESLKKLPWIHEFMQRKFPLRGNRLCVIAHKPEIIVEAIQPNEE